MLGSSWADGDLVGSDRFDFLDTGVEAVAQGAEGFDFQLPGFFGGGDFKTLLLQRVADFPSETVLIDPDRIRNLDPKEEDFSRCLGTVCLYYQCFLLAALAMAEGEDRFDPTFFAGLIDFLVEPGDGATAGTVDAADGDGVLSGIFEREGDVGLFVGDGGLGFVDGALPSEAGVEGGREAENGCQKVENGVRSHAETRRRKGRAGVSCPGFVVSGTPLRLGILA